jgi:hypothetical protein
MQARHSCGLSAVRYGACSQNPEFEGFSVWVSSEEIHFTFASNSSPPTQNLQLFQGIGHKASEVRRMSHLGKDKEREMNSNQTEIRAA